VAAVEHDVRSAQSWAATVSACREQFGPPSVLINNAGVMLVGPIETATVADFETCFAVNTIGIFLGMQAVLATMRDNGGGAIVNMASNAGVVGTYGLPAYSASKAATIALTKTAAIEFGAAGIRVNAIAPGGVDTPMSNQPEFEGMDKSAWYSGLPIARIGQPEEIARLQLFLASTESSYCTGSVFLADGGQLAGPKAF
jgi:3alpha(or 20beta)-hydroxysteroid dehydrogenase